MNLVIVEAFTGLFFNSTISSSGGSIAGYIDFGKLQPNAKDIGVVGQWAAEMGGGCTISRQNDIRV